MGDDGAPARGVIGHWFLSLDGYWAADLGTHRVKRSTM